MTPPMGPVGNYASGRTIFLAMIVLCAMAAFLSNMGPAS